MVLVVVGVCDGDVLGVWWCGVVVGGGLWGVLGFVVV